MAQLLPKFCYLCLNSISLADELGQQNEPSARYGIVRKHLPQLLRYFINDHRTIKQILRLCSLKSFECLDEIGEFFLLACEKNIRTACLILMHCPWVLSYVNVKKEDAYLIATGHGKLKLLKNLCNRRKPNKSRYSRLSHCAAWRDEVVIYRWLSSQRTVGTPTEKELTYAVQGDSIKVMKFIFETYYNPIYGGQHWEQLLSKAKSQAMIQLFKRPEINIDNALYFAIWNERIESVVALLNSGANYPLQERTNLLIALTSKADFSLIRSGCFLSNLAHFEFDPSILCDIWTQATLVQLIVYCSNTSFKAPNIAVPKSALKYIAKWTYSLLLYRYFPSDIIDIVGDFYYPSSADYWMLLGLSKEPDDLTIVPE